MGTMNTSSQIEKIRTIRGKRLTIIGNIRIFEVVFYTGEDGNKYFRAYYRVKGYYKTFIWESVSNEKTIKELSNILDMPEDLIEDEITMSKQYETKLKLSIRLPRVTITNISKDLFYYYGDIKDHDRNSSDSGTRIGFK